MTNKEPTEISQSQNDKWPVIFVVPFAILFPKYIGIFPEDFPSTVASAVLAGLGGLIGYCSYLYTESKSVWVKLVALVTLLLPTFIGLRFV